MSSTEEKQLTSNSDLDSKPLSSTPKSSSLSDSEMGGTKKKPSKKKFKQEQKQHTRKRRKKVEEKEPEEEKLENSEEIYEILDFIKDTLPANKVSQCTDYIVFLQSKEGKQEDALVHTYLKFMGKTPKNIGKRINRFVEKPRLISTTSRYIRSKYKNATKISYEVYVVPFKHAKQFRQMLHEIQYKETA